ncbi:Autophagy protein 22 [Linnemannia zychae]|nr:Autophagy protein 22 [Linnemannia zychae]
MAVLIAQDQLHATNDALIYAVLVQYIFAGCSMSFWVWLQNARGVKPLTVIIINACLFGLVPIYALTRLIANNPMGLKNTWELYMVAVIFGLFVGTIYSSNMVLFSEFIPIGHENEFYSLFEMASTTSAWIGPLVCTGIIESFGIRHTYWFLASQYYIPALILSFVDVDKGRQEAIDFYNMEQKKIRSLIEKEEPCDFNKKLDDTNLSDTVENM